MELRKIIRAFLASPGDLQPERVSIKETVDEINDLIANPQGYHFELVGWEYTVSGPGRAQGIINRELERCEIFIGLMWKKWGTPPSIGGPYTSGFEEEFELSIKRMEACGYPRMSLYFKDVPQAALDDPGPELDKVLRFKEALEQRRLLLYETFGETRPIEKRIRKLLATYVQEKLQAQIEESLVDQPKEDTFVVKSPREQSSTSPATSDSGALSFIEEIHSLPEGFDNITGLQVARLRLIGQSVWRNENDTGALGVHDANLIYANRAAVSLDQREIRTLFVTGLKSFSSGNIPLWHWLSALPDDYNAELTQLSALNTDDALKEGALQAMRLLGARVWHSEIFKREYLIERWFASSTSVKIAALRYLSLFGELEDAPQVDRELSGNDFGTKRPALEALIQIYLRSDPGRAVQIALENSMESLSGPLLNILLPHFGHLSAEQLEKALNHSNASIRESVVSQALSVADAVDERARKLASDSKASVRAAAARYLLTSGDLSVDNLRALLVRPEAVPSGATAFLLGSDESGNREFEQVRREGLAQLSDSELEVRRARAGTPNDLAYFAQCRRNYEIMRSDLRENVADRFHTFFRLGIEKMWRDWGSESKDLIERTEALGEEFRKTYLIEAVHVIADCKRGADIDLVREAIRDRVYKDVLRAADYLGEFGNREDVDLLVSMITVDLSPQVVRYDVTEDDIAGVARAILKLMRGQLRATILRRALPARLRMAIILAAAPASFAKVPRQGVMEMLFDDDEGVRRLAAVKYVLSSTKRSTVSLLKDYVSQNRAYYYNVVHWLDMGASLSVRDARRAASRALDLVQS